MSTKSRARNAEDYTSKINTLLNQSQVRLAHRTAKEGLEMFPDNYYLLKKLIEIKRSLGRVKSAKKLSNRLARKFPSKWESHIYVAQDMLTLGTLKCKNSDTLFLGRFNESKVLRNLEDSIPKIPNNKWEQKSLARSIIAHESSQAGGIKKDLWVTSYSIAAEKIQQNEILKDKWQPFQYWSQGEQPDDVKQVTNKWNQLLKSLGLKGIKVFDKREAGIYIKHSCPELSISFRTAFHYAIEADIFRAAFARHNTCIWLDSDIYPTAYTKRELKGILSEERTTLLFRWIRPWLNNAFFATTKDSFFFKTLVSQTKDFNFNRHETSKKTITNSFGPARYNRVLESCITAYLENIDHKTAQRSFPDSMKLNFVNDNYFLTNEPPFKLKYKETSDSWHKNF